MLENRSSLHAQRRGEAAGLAAVVAVGGEAVDVVRADAGVLARSDHRLQGEFEFGVGRLAVAVVGRLADADDRGLTAEGAGRGHGHTSPASRERSAQRAG